MENCYIFISQEHDIHFNLAFEKYLVEEFDKNSNVLFLWQNNPVVVIGRYQNPWEECNLNEMSKDNVALARRSSGGGAVYQDLGNICFTIIAPFEDSDKARNFSIVIKALNMMGLNASVSGRNDIIINEKKVSGSAFQTTKGRFCHHGTMLISTNLLKLSSYLTPNKHKMESHGVKSVESRVANLSQFYPNATTEEFAKCIQKCFAAEFSEKEKTQKNSRMQESKIKEQCPVKLVSKAQIREISSLGPSFENFSSKEWNFGKSPTFTNKLSGRIETGTFTFYLVVKKGLITSVSIASDTLETKEMGELEKKIEGLHYDPIEIRKKANVEKDIFISKTLAFLATLIEQV